MFRGFLKTKAAQIEVFGAHTCGCNAIASVQSEGRTVYGSFRPGDIDGGKLNVLVIGEDGDCYGITYNSDANAYGFMPMVVMIPKEKVQFV